MRLELSTGGHVTLREKVSIRGRMLEAAYLSPTRRFADKLRESDAKPTEPVDTVVFRPDELVDMWAFNAAVVVARLESWSFDTPVPRTVDELLDCAALEGAEGQKRYVEISKAATDLYKANRVPTFGANPDKTSPTTASLDSEQSSSEADRVRSNGKSPSSTPSSSSEVALPA